MVQKNDLCSVRKGFGFVWFFCLFIEFPKWEMGKLMTAFFFFLYSNALFLV